jgi:hypothetical protein
MLLLDETDVKETREEIEKLCDVIDQLRRFWTPADTVNLGGYSQGAAWFLDTLSTKPRAKTWKTRPWDQGAMQKLLVEHISRMGRLVDEIDTFSETAAAALPGVDLVQLKEYLVESIMSDANSLYFETAVQS